MFKRFLTPRVTTRTDIAVAIAAAVIAMFKAIDTYTTYQKEQGR